MPLKRISGLFLKIGRNGSKFTAGSTREPINAGAKLLVFQNDRKQSDRDPDYVLLLSQDDDTTHQRPSGDSNRTHTATRSANAVAAHTSAVDGKQRLDDFESARQACAGDEVVPW